jgi:asparagine synthase (glutamine-hydrolysing)
MAMPLLPKRVRIAHPGDKLHKFADLLSTGNPEDLYYDLVSHWKTPADVALDSLEPVTYITNRDQWADLPNFNEQMMYLDFLTYLTTFWSRWIGRAWPSVSNLGPHF